MFEFVMLKELEMEKVGNQQALMGMWVVGQKKGGCTSLPKTSYFGLLF